MFSIGRDVSFSIKERLDFPGVKTFSFIWGEFINLFWDVFSFIQGIFINRRWTLVCGQTVWPKYVRYVAAIKICAALVGSVFVWRRATGERKTCWCKRSVSLVSGMIGGIM